MRKFIFVAAAAISVVCFSPALAAPAEPFSSRRHFSSEDMSAFADARIAALKAGLKLTPEQEKNWPALETAMRDIAKARIARVEEMRETGPGLFDTDPIGALQRRARNLAARSGEMEKLSTAAKPLYDSLDDAQKRRFGALLRSAIRERMGRGHGRGPMGGGMGGPGME
ncbi:Spy/CpxP family protein refolding chaperone [Methylocystis sp. WRRC1]|uniref:Spy/CpxP family protein refolding chaperone n=1 Tax=unclassified Methylocystis TaxID=2625913 RepID=UPI0001F86EEB|nr:MULTISPECIES: Spy/CpxP family protein refolding chaperone [unclassified Methylocystis]MCC3244953.1 Spy/CpxP family protein refolding chaperone [Methylocystis sp. WRRC1]